MFLGVILPLVSLPHPQIIPVMRDELLKIQPMASLGAYLRGEIPKIRPGFMEQCLGSLDDSVEQHTMSYNLPEIVL